MERDIQLSTLSEAIKDLYTDLDKERGLLGPYPNTSLTQGRAHQAEVDAIANQRKGVERLVWKLQQVGYLIPPETTRSGPDPEPSSG